jgi:hypothetical protein
LAIFHPIKVKKIRQKSPLATMVTKVGWIEVDHHPPILTKFGGNLPCGLFFGDFSSILSK